MSFAPQVSKKALVLSGGGADGAYAVGAIKALVSGRSPSTGYRPLDPDIFTGTSCGAYNSAVLASLWDDFGIASIANLESIWLDRLAGSDTNSNGFYRILANPVPFFRPQTWLSSPLGPLSQLFRDSAKVGSDGIERLAHFATAWDESLEQRFVELFNFSSFVTCDPFEDAIQDTIRFDKIRNSSKVLKIAATDWLNGKIRMFEGPEMTDDLGCRAVKASASIPGFLPPVAVGSQLYVDGGVLLNTPLKPAIGAGADELHVVYLDPDISSIPLAHVKNTAESFYRMIQIMWAAAVNTDIQFAATINAGLEIIDRIAHGAKPSAEDSLTFVRVASVIADRSGHLVRRPLVIHRYHPREDLGGELGLLNFGRERLRGLIERGFNETVQHDCTISGCVFPGGSHR